MYTLLRIPSHWASVYLSVVDTGAQDCVGTLLKRVLVVPTEEGIVLKINQISGVPKLG